MHEESQPKSENNTEFPVKPRRLPSPTYWPFFMAFSLLFMGWGLLTIWIIFTVGIIGFFISLGGWINDLRNERENEQ